MSQTDPRFSRTEMLLGEDALKKLANSRVIVFGIGGVGGYVVEALARSGVGALDVVDKDTVDITNINRQIIATTATVGIPKVDVAKERILSINPACCVTAHKCFFLPETASEFDFSAYDYCVDAVDTVTAKLAVIEHAQKARTPVISALGAGNKLDPIALRVADIYETSIDPLARIMRKECKKRGIPALKVVYSLEPPLVPQSDAAPAPGKRTTPGSVPYVPSVMGLIIASEVVKDLL
ncbi:MAG: tRNA threonylcarbamoyladenosine dehydratase [Coriobacteriales bacterium]|nr:tRNA threonylcarbamoyladenosine dehydratase [Coriobacteriales bacterium]